MREEKLEYNKEFIDTVESLSQANHRILITKNGDSVTIKGNNEASNFCYILTAPTALFNQTVDKIAIIDFTRFKKFYEAMSSKTVASTLMVSIDDQNDATDMIFTNEGRSDKLTLRLGDSSMPTFKASFNTLAEHEVDVEGVMDEDMIDQIQRKISLVGGDYIDVTANDHLLNFCIYTMRSADKADHPVFLEKNPTKFFSLKFAAQILNLIPKGKYKMEIDSDGAISLVQERENGIRLEIMLLAEE